MKICIMCGKEKPYSEYYKHKNMSDGHLGRCKECHKSEMRRNRSEKSDYYKEYDAIRYKTDPNVRERHRKYALTESGKSSISAAKRRFIENNPEKRRAHNIVKNAVRNGSLLKPIRCSICNSENERRNIHAHHEDYSKPLDVVWMCAKCHKERHKKNT